MTLTSFYFFTCFIISLFAYYLVPKKYQWYALLAFSFLFFVVFGTPWTGIYLLISVIITWFCGRKIAVSHGPKAKLYLAVGIIANLIILAILKYTNFAINNLNFVFDTEIGNVSFPAPLGISFYSLQIIAYLLDVYWKIATCQNNVLKFALFTSYYPQMISGPITRYNNMQPQLFCGHDFDWKMVTFGLQRMLWGVFKKLVISSRLGVVVDTIYSNTDIYNGFYIWIAAVTFMIQLYADFSGCMDIVIGASECYGIVLPENFTRPFFSKNVQEFWKRWHITLGMWLQDYVLYPLLRSKLWSKMTKTLKTKFGKKIAKQVPSYLAMLIVWLLIGLWHGGGWKYIVGQGGFFFFCIMLSDIFENRFRRIRLKIFKDESNFLLSLFRFVKITVLVSAGNLFFRLNSFRDTFKVIKLGIAKCNVDYLIKSERIFPGIKPSEIILEAVCVLLLLTVGILQEKKSIRERLAETNIAVRWTVFVLLILSIAVFGQYGPDYIAQDFIYEAF